MAPPRSKDPIAIAKNHLVPTTYSTLVSDYGKAGVLQNFLWFRVVLDEGEAPIAVRFLKEAQERLRSVKHIGSATRRPDNSRLPMHCAPIEDGVLPAPQFRIDSRTSLRFFAFSRSNPLKAGAQCQPSGRTSSIPCIRTMRILAKAYGLCSKACA